MNKKIALLVTGLLLSMGLAGGCSKDDKQQEQLLPPADTTATSPMLFLPLKLTGWTLGSNAYASFIPSEGDTLRILVDNVSDNPTINLKFISDTWGTAMLHDVKVTYADTAFVLSKPITATLREDRSAWDFSGDVDSIAMPNRNPQSEEISFKNYPIVLTSGTISLDGSSWQFDFKAYLVPRSEHIQMMSFRNGHVPSTQPGQ